MAVGGVLGISVELAGKDVGFGEMLKTMKAGFSSAIALAEAAKTRMLESFGAIREASANVFRVGAFLAGLTAFAKNAGDLVAALRQVRVFAGASEEELNGSAKAITSTATALKGFSTKEASEAFAQLARATNSVKDAQEILQPALALSRIGFGEPASAAEFLRLTLKQFRLEATDAGRVADALAVATTKLGVQADEARAGLARLSKGVAGSRISFEDAVVAASLAGAGIRDGFAGGARAVGRLLEEASLDARKSLRRFGGADAGDLFGAFERQAARGASSAAQFTRQLQASGATKNEIRAFGAIFEGVNQVIAKSNGEITTVAGALAKLRGELGRGKGLADRAAQALTGDSQVIAAAWDAIIADAARAVGRAIKPITELVRKGVVAFGEFWKSIPDPVKESAAKLLVFVGVLGSLAGSLVALKVLAGVALSALVAFGPGILATTLLLAPLYAAVLAVAGAAYVVKRAYDDNLGGFADRVNKTVGDVQTVWRGLVQVFTTGGELSGKTLEDLEKNPSLLKLVARLYALGYRFSELWNGISFQVERSFEKLEPTFKAISASFERLVAAFFGGGGKIADLANTASSAWFGKGQEIGSVLGELARLLTEGVKVGLEFVEAALLRSGPSWDKHKEAILKFEKEAGNLKDTVLALFDGIGKLLPRNAEGRVSFDSLAKSLQSFEAKDFVRKVNDIVDVMARLISATSDFILFAKNIPGAVKTLVDLTPLEFFGQLEDRKVRKEIGAFGNFGPVGRQSSLNTIAGDLEDELPRGGGLPARSVTVPASEGGVSSEEIKNAIAVGFSQTQIEQTLNVSIDKEVFASLVREVTPGTAFSDVTIEGG